MPKPKENVITCENNATKFKESVIAAYYLSSSQTIRQGLHWSMKNLKISTSTHVFCRLLHLLFFFFFN